MKKSIIILLIVAMLAGIGLVSCKNEIQVPADELVSVSFKNDSSRALSANLEEFKPENYYWKYAAKKADSSNLLSGQTPSYNEDGAQWIRQGQPGFGTGTTPDDYEAYTVEGFSQGLWDFMLFAYKDDAGNVLVYQGEASAVLLKKGGNHTVSAVVSPAGTEDGTLKVLVDEIKLVAAAGAEVVANARMKLEVTRVSDSEVIRPLDFVSEDYEVGLEHGQYFVRVLFTNDDGVVTYAAGSVVATVYSGLTTSVSGSLAENLTYADFAASSDVIATTIGTDDPIVEDAGSLTDVVELKGETDKVSASLSNDTAQKLITALKEDYQADDTSSSMALNLSVDTTEATETTITYEIGMEAVLTYMKESVETTTTSNVEEVADFVTVVIELQSGLLDVNVKHSNVSMTKCESLDELNSKMKSQDPQGVGFFFYDSANGKLHIKTWKFSPFKLSYTIPEAVAAIGSQTYYSLDAAVTAVQAGQTIQLLKDITFGEDHSVDIWEKAFNLDLNGHTFETKSGVDKDLSNLGYKASAVVYALEGKVAVKNGTIKTAYGAGIYAAGVELTVEDVVIKAAQTGVQPTDEYSSAVRLTSEASVIINSGSFEAVTAGGHAVAVSNSGGDVVINGGSFKSDLFFSASTNTGVSKTITIKGGDFTNFKVNQGGVDKTAGGLDKGTLVITGGKFDVDPTAYVAEGYIADYNSQTQKWTVREATEDDYVASVTQGELVTKYFSLQSAVVAAQNDDTVTLLKSVSVGSKIEIDKTITLDLDGYTITGTEHAKDAPVFEIANGGSLTIDGTDSGSAINADATAVLGKAGSTLVVNGGSYSNSYFDDKGDTDPKNDEGSYVFDIKGTATINSATLTAVIKGIRADKQDGASSAGTVLVSRSTASVAPKWGLFAAGKGGELTVDKGTYTTTYPNQKQMIDIKNNGKVTITDGTFETIYTGSEPQGAPAIAVFNGNGTTAGGGNCLIIEGGSFKYGGDIAYFNPASVDNISITGGTFFKDPSAYVADGYYAKYHPAAGTDPEYWTVEAIPEGAIFALINNDTSEIVKFITDANLTDIYGDGSVPAKHTLRLLKNYEYKTSGTTMVSLIQFGGDEIVLDLGGFELTVDAYYINCVLCADGHEELTITNGTITSKYADKSLFYGWGQPFWESFQSNKGNGVTYKNINNVPDPLQP